MSEWQLPQVIQGGMGVGVSDWRLAQAVARRGQLGVVSGTAIDTVFVRRLQDGDVDGHLRRAMACFPMPDVATEVLRRYFRPHGRAAGEAYQLLPMYQQSVSTARHQLTMLAAFCEVHLAKEGHAGPIGINLLTKIQLPNLALLYGAMLAGVDVVLMGAGIPRDVPAALDALAEHLPATLRFDVEGADPDISPILTLVPAEFWDDEPPVLMRPRFFPIVASNSLATMLARKGGRIDGFIVEGFTAGGHNAPPRGTPAFNARHEPIYGARDAVDLAQIVALGLPFWVAGGAGSPEGLQAARAAGAAGIQVGTLFAFADESGLDALLKRSVLEAALHDRVDVFTDPLASPTGYPFKVVHWPGDPAVETQRERICDLGYLRSAVALPSGRIEYRCPSEPVDTWVKKRGDPAAVEGRQCLCNGLLANIGMAQVREEGLEPPLLTSGDDLLTIRDFLRGRTHFSAGDVLDHLLGAPADRSASTSAAVVAC